MEDLIIRTMTGEDLPQAAGVHKEAFPRQTRSEEWLECTFQAAPRMLCYVAIVRGVVAGYICWGQKSGFRPEAIVELEQLAVLPALQGRGIGTRLIARSLELVRGELADHGSRLKHVIVTTRADNFSAQALYKNLLGAEIEATITNLYSADEVFMVGRNL